MSNTSRLLSAMLLTIVSFRVFFYFTPKPLQAEILDDFNCSNCSQILMYHDCIGKRAALTNIIPISFAEMYMECESMMPQFQQFGLDKELRETMNECTFCLLWVRQMGWWE